MENKGFSEIRQKCQKFKRLLLGQTQNNSISDIIKQVETINHKRQVLSLSKIIQDINKNQIKIPQIQQPGTSCYSSDMCSDDEPSFDKTDDEKKHKKTLTYTQIESMLIDDQSFAIVDQYKSNWVLFQDIRNQLDYYEFVNFLENLQKTPEILQLYFCFYQEKYSVIVQFQQEKQMEKFCNSCFKGLTNFMALLGNHFKIIWIAPSDINSHSPSTDIDLLYYGVLKKRKKKVIFFSKNFVGVVLRNYPSKYDCNELKQLLKKKIQVECKLKQQIEFKKQRFALLTFDTIEDAEKAIVWMKERSTESDLHKLKINLHQYSNFVRDPLIKNVYGDLFKNNIDKDKIQQVLTAFEIKVEDNDIQQTLLKDPKNSINFESEPEEGEINQESLRKKDPIDNYQYDSYQNDRRQQYRRDDYYDQQQGYDQQRNNRGYDRNYRRRKITRYNDNNYYRRQKQIQ